MFIFIHIKVKKKFLLEIVSVHNINLVLPLEIQRQIEMSSDESYHLRNIDGNLISKDYIQFDSKILPRMAKHFLFAYGPKYEE